MKKKRLVFIGGGGHAKVLIDTAEACGRFRIEGILDPSIRKNRKVAGYPVLGSDSMLEGLKGVSLVNGVGTVRASGKRKVAYERCKRMGFEFPVLVHPKAYITKTAKLEEGVQILAGAIVNSHASIGRDSIINTRAIIEHDCRIGPHVHVATGAILGGGVTVGECSHIGMGSRVLQGVRIGRRATVGAGAVVTRDVKDGKTVVGVPAREKNA